MLQEISYVAKNMSKLTYHMIPYHSMSVKIEKKSKFGKTKQPNYVSLK